MLNFSKINIFLIYLIFLLIAFFSILNFQNQKEPLIDKKVNLTDLLARLEVEKKKEIKKNVALSTAAISAIAVFGIILTL